MKIALVVVGWTLDILGIVLVAAPELFPRLRHAYGIGAAWSRRRVAELRRALRRPTHQNIVGLRASIEGGGRVSAHGVVTRSAPPDATLEERLEFVSEEVSRAHDRLNELERQVAELPEQWRRDDDAVRRHAEEVVRDELSRARDAYIRYRLVGIGVLVVGSSMLAVANLV